MRTRFSTVALALAVLLGVAPGSPAEAAPHSRKEAAERFQKGVGLYKEGDYAAALAEFRAAYEASPTWEVLYNIGLTERRLFRYGQAVQTFARYLEEGGKRVPKDRRDNVQRELEQISALTAKVTVKVDGPPARLFVDGEPLGVTPLPDAVLLGSGPHTFKAERDGFIPVEKSLEVVSRKDVTLELVLKPKEDTSAPADVTIESSPPGAIITIDGKLAGLAPTKVKLLPGGHEVLADLEGFATTRIEVVVSAGQSRKVTVAMEKGGGGEGGGGRRVRVPVAGLITLGVGLGLVGGGVGLALKAQADAKKVSDLFRTGGTWDANAIALESSGHAAQTWGWVLLVTGSAATVTGIILSVVTLVRSGGDDSDESALFLVPTPQGATLGWTTRF
ncbi:MAG: PEGA domain-containing protein [Myxococcota bacterium]